MSEDCRPGKQSNIREKYGRSIDILRSDGPRALANSISLYICNSVTPSRRVRADHRQLLKEREGLVIAECGVWRADNAKTLLEGLDVEKMYLIDPYTNYDGYESSPKTDSTLHDAKREARRKLQSYDTLEWIEKPSQEAADEISEPLDYAYIDGNHTYDYVKADMEAYYSLLDDDGILAGHDVDFTGGDVAEAFVDFAVENDLQPYLEGDCSDWYFIKGDRKRHS